MTENKQSETSEQRDGPTGSVCLSPSVCAEIDKWLKKFPASQRQSAILAALTAAQEDNGGYLSEPLIEAVADYLQIPKIAAFEAATFYSLFNLQPVGKHVISVCTNISCMLCGSKKIADYLQEKLGIGFGETSKDGKYTLREVECLAACANAPMMLIDKTYHEDLNPEKIDKILVELDN